MLIFKSVFLCGLLDNGRSLSAPCYNCMTRHVCVCVCVCACACVCNCVSVCVCTHMCVGMCEESVIF